MAANNVTCDLCGGTEFFADAGHYYCKECQTQSQDIREQQFVVSDQATATRTTTVKKTRKKKDEDLLTTWECYNYIVFGLVKELIELGADPKLKNVMHILWFKYLIKLEVISDKPDVLPKLCAVNNQKNAEIIYGRGCKRKRSGHSHSISPAPSSETASTNVSLLKQEKTKQRRTMVLAHYNEASNPISENTSLHNQSLSSLKSGSDASNPKDKYLQFSRGSRKELLKMMSKNHLKSHCRDIDSTLHCHKLPEKVFSRKFLNSSEVLSRNKIFALIYLGLLINKDKVQLGDMLRFIREGSLSYYNVEHFFPENCQNRLFSIKSWNYGNKQICHYRIREVAADIAKSLKITKYIPCQNLVDLCQRYCTELNLPDEVWGYALNLMSKATPKMHFTMDSQIIPNYEGRAMSFIIFFLKLVFGLDELTEEEFSKYAERLNDANITETKMFKWKDWVCYINYRKLVLMQHHFPTKYLFDYKNVENSELFIDFMNEQHSKCEEDLQLTRTAEVLTTLLKELKMIQLPTKETLSFLPTLTPFSDYVQVILDSVIPQNNNYLVDVLSHNFKNCSLKFLINPIFYLEELNRCSKVGIKHRGANNNLAIVSISNYKVEREAWRRAAKRDVYVRISKTKVNSGLDISSGVNKTNQSKERNSELIIKSFEQNNMKLFTRNWKRLLKKYKKSKLNKIFEESNKQSFTQINTTEDVAFSHELSFNESVFGQSTMTQTQNNRTRTQYIHYTPYDRYWVKHVWNITREAFSEFISKFPNSFQLILNECSRITEESSWELFDEFLITETYLSYVAKFENEHKAVNKDLQKFTQRASFLW